MERQAGGTPSRSDAPSFTRTAAPRSPSGTPRDFSIVEKRSTPSMRARQPASAASAAAVTKKAAEVVIVGEEVFAGREAPSRGSAAAAEVNVAVPSPSPQLTGPVVSSANRASPVLSALSDLMRTKQTLRTAIALQEIFGPPRCRRGHRQGRGSRAYRPSVTSMRMHETLSREPQSNASCPKASAQAWASACSPDARQDLLVGHDTREAVRAQENAVPGLHGDDAHVRTLSDLLGTQVLPQHVLETVAAGFFRRNGLGLDERLGQ